MVPEGRTAYPVTVRSSATSVSLGNTEIENLVPPSGFIQTLSSTKNLFSEMNSVAENDSPRQNSGEVFLATL